jgi:hypothetical protein
VEERKVADHLGVARRRVRLATAQEALRASGFAVGTVAPFGAPPPPPPPPPPPLLHSLASPARAHPAARPPAATPPRRPAAAASLPLQATPRR